MNTIKTSKNSYGTVDVYIDGVQVAPEYSQSVYNHSPDGFQVGYCGSGPAQCALAILLRFTDKKTALRWYQDFKYEFVSHWEEDGTYEVDINGWLKALE